MYLSKPTTFVAFFFELVCTEGWDWESRCGGGWIESYSRARIALVEGAAVQLTHVEAAVKCGQLDAMWMAWVPDVPFDTNTSLLFALDTTLPPAVILGRRGWTRLTRRPSGGCACSCGFGLLGAERYERPCLLKRRRVTSEESDL